MVLLVLRMNKDRKSKTILQYKPTGTRATATPKKRWIQ